MAAENFKVKKGLEVGTGITANSDGINVTGIITATQYRGDGSGLTGVVASGTGIIIKDEGSAVGTAGTINFAGSGVAATLSAGTATITIDSGGLTDVVNDTTPQLGGNLDLNSKFITGTGNIDITGSLDVSGISTTGFLEVNNLTNGRVAYVGSTSGRLVDSANLTFDGTNLFVSGINVTSAGTTSTFGADIVTRNFKATGISTFNSHLSIGGALTASSGTFTNNVSVGGNMTATLFDISPGSGNDAIILVSSGGGQNNDFSRIRQVVSDDSFRIENKASGSYESLLRGTGSGGVKLYFAGNEKLTTTINGIEVPDLNVTGVGTVGRLDTSGVTLGTNATTFAAKFADNARAIFGGATNGDFGIYHDTNHSYLQRIPGGTGDIYMMLGGDNAIIAKTDNSVELYWDDAKKLETDNAGVKITGVCTATSFSGDGSGLTGITASGSGILVKHDGSNVGTAGTINFSTNLDVSPISAGIVTVTASGGGGGVSLANGVDNRVVTATGAAALNGETNLTWDGTTLAVVSQQTVSGSVVVGSGVTIDARGINAVGTAVTAGTFHADGGNFRAQIGATNQGFYLYNGASTHLAINWSSSASRNQFRGTGNHPLWFEDFSYIQISPSSTYVRLDYGESEKLITDQAGVKITGVCTATTFSGSGASLTTLNASELDSGTIPNGRFPATLPATSGANLTNLPVPTQISVASESSDTNTFLVFTSGATGNQSPKTNSTLTFNSTTEVLSATKFSGSGETLTNLNASNIASGTMSASRLTGALPAISGANLTNLPAQAPTATDVQVAYELINTSGSGNGWRINGNGIVNTTGNPDLYLIRGQKYRFINNSGGSHPFQIQSDASTAYGTGVTNNNASSGNIDFVPRNDAPARLYYNCTQHGGMLGNIYLRGAGGNETNVGIITATRFSGNGSSLTNLPAGNLTGTVADARISTLTASKLSGALPAISGASLTNLNGSAITSGTIDAARVATLNQSTTGNAATATAFSVTSNNTTNETVYPVFVDGNSGTQGAEVDTALTYNPSSNTLTTGTIDLGNVNISSGTVSSSSNAVTIDTTAVGSCSAIEYTIYVSNSTNIQSQKVLIMDNGTTAYISEFSVMSNPNLIVTFTADVSSGNVRLIATKESGISGSVSYKFSKMIIE